MGVIRGLLSLLGRLLLALIFLGSGAMNHIPNFNGVVQEMTKEGVPAPTVSHVLAIAFMLVGGISLVIGYRARFGATLLLIFLALACFYFHDFWTFEDPAQAQEQQIHFMKNLAMMGGMLIVIANGPGAWSIDGCCKEPAADESLPG
jgi:putative oxidoreductase